MFGIRMNVSSSERAVTLRKRSAPEPTPTGTGAGQDGLSASVAKLPAYLKP